MKHFYSLFLALTVSILTFSANSKPFTLNIDHADRVTVKINYDGQPMDLVDGENTFEVNVDSYDQVIVELKSGFLFDRIVNKAGTPKEVYGTSAYFYTNPQTTDDDLYYTVTTGDEESLRTATMTVKVDEPSKVKIRTSMTYREIDLSENEQQVKFIPGESKESPFSIFPAGNDAIYKVTINGNNVTPSYGSYTVNVADGDVLEILVNYPDEDFTVKINEKDEASFVQSVKCNGEPVENWADFSAKAGSSITISGNTTDYCFEKIEVGGQTITYMYGDYSFTLTDNTVVDVYAHKWGTFDVSIDIDDADNVEIYQSDRKLDIQSGKHDYAFTESQNYVYINIKASAAGILKSVTHNGQSVDVTYGAQLSIVKGDEIVVTTEKIVRDWKAMLFFEGRNDIYYVSLANTDTRKDIVAGDNIAEGYNPFNFGAVDLPAGLSFQPNDNQPAVVFINGEKKSPFDENAFSYQFEDLADNDVIKVFVNGEPEKYELSFDMPEETDGITVTHDYLCPVTDFTTACTNHKGTVYTLTVPDAEKYEATLGEQALTFDENNTVEFIPESDAKLTVAKTSGIEAVDAEVDAAKAVYNLQGIKVGNGLQGLPAGIYIIGGKKVYVK